MCLCIKKRSCFVLFDVVYFELKDRNTGHFRVPKNPHFQNEASCTTFLVKMSFICMRMKNDFRIKGWARTLVLKQRLGELENGLLALTEQSFLGNCMEILTWIIQLEKCLG